MTTPPPAASRLTIRSKRNKRLAGSLWSRLPAPGAIADACGRAARRALPAVAIASAAGVLGTGGYLGYRFVTTSPRFAITQIQVRGAHHVSDDAVRDALPVRVGDNVFAGDLDALAAGLRGNPWIDTAAVRRVLPHTLVVDLHERTPVAMVELGALYLVDATGHVFKRADAADDAGPVDAGALPVITGLDRAAVAADPEAAAGLIRDALAALRTWTASASRPAIGEVHIDTHGALTLRTFDEATAIQLGTLDPAQLAPRIDTFDAAWAQLTAAERQRARAIHLDTRPDHVTVAFAKDQ